LFLVSGDGNSTYISYCAVICKYFSSNASPESFVENLQKAAVTTVSSYNHAAQSCVRQLAQNSPNPESFTVKYEELKAKK
jgi:hypothetical protein